MSTEPRRPTAIARCLLVLAALAACGAADAAGPADDGNGGTIILDTMGFWRMHHELAPPLIQMDGKLAPALIEQSWMNRRTPAAPAGWQKADFDDSSWFRGPALRAIRSPWLARLAMRARFEVTDPQKVKGLRLSADFHGGMVVYLNGQEIARQNVPPGEVGPETLAEPYPPEAFADETGKMLFPGNIRWHDPSGGDFWKDKKVPPESQRRMGLWQRTLDATVPAAALRKGTNVLAVLVIRATYDKSVQAAKEAFEKKNEQFAYQVFFCTCEVDGIRMTAGGADGIVPATVRPRGLQAWNSDAAAPDVDQDYGDPLEPLRPVALVAPRGGAASGKIVLGDTKPIRGLKATATELRGEKGSIPASAVRLRYGLPWDTEAIFEGLRQAPNPYPYPPTPLACLSDAPPATVPLCAKDYPPFRPTPVRGAVVSVWATVNVPPATPAGLYRGHFTVTAEGERPIQAPLEVRVDDWAAPPPQEFAGWVDLIESPDTLALEYGDALWSEAHWKKVEKSLSLLGEAGNRTLYAPLIAHTNLGNEQSMVRWVRKEGGPSAGSGQAKFDYDFTVLDRYLDAAIRNMGKPEVLICSVWELYMLDPSGKMPEDERYTKEIGSDLRATRQERMPLNIREHGGKVGLGPLVTALDKSTGKADLLELPRLSEANAKELWQPMLTQLREHLAKRGLEKALHFGMNCDAWADKATVRFFNECLPGTPWVVESHDGFPTASLKLLHGMVPVGYQTRVWGVAFADEDRHDPYRINRKGEANAAGRLYGWGLPERLALFERFSLSPFPATRWRSLVEVNVTGMQRGIGRLGADYWPAIKAKDGRRTAIVHERYPESHWRNLTIRSSVLGPGVDGPAATRNFEAFREGLQECEARVEIEKALADAASRATLGEDLEKRCREHLDERLQLTWYSLSNFQMHAGGYDSGVQYATGWRYAPGVYGQTWFIGSGWRERSEALYKLAGDVQKKLGK